MVDNALLQCVIVAFISSFLSLRKLVITFGHFTVPWIFPRGIAKNSQAASMPNHDGGSGKWFGSFFYCGAQSSRKDFLKFKPEILCCRIPSCVCREFLSILTNLINFSIFFQISIPTNLVNLLMCSSMKSATVNWRVISSVLPTTVISLKVIASSKSSSW